jgi:hypothetical protein
MTHEDGAMASRGRLRSRAWLAYMGQEAPQLPQVLFSPSMEAEHLGQVPLWVLTRGCILTFARWWPLGLYKEQLMEKS